MDIIEILDDIDKRLSKPRAPASILSLMTDFNELLKEELEIKTEETPWLRNWNKRQYWKR